MRRCPTRPPAFLSHIRGQLINFIDNLPLPHYDGASVASFTAWATVSTTPVLIESPAPHERPVRHRCCERCVIDDSSPGHPNRDIAQEVTHGTNASRSQQSPLLRYRRRGGLAPSSHDPWRLDRLCPRADRRRTAEVWRDHPAGRARASQSGSAPEHLIHATKYRQPGLQQSGAIPLWTRTEKPLRSDHPA